LLDARRRGKTPRKLKNSSTSINGSPFLAATLSSLGRPVAIGAEAVLCLCRAIPKKSGDDDHQIKGGAR